jgi:hypothetical protein
MQMETNSRVLLLLFTGLIGVTGELAPPANPLICPQFWSVCSALPICLTFSLALLLTIRFFVLLLFISLRFNDLDNIGLTGRHYSGFIMLGIQVSYSEHNFACCKCEKSELALNLSLLLLFATLPPPGFQQAQRVQVLDE